MTLRKRVGAFSDEELRILLVEAGALKVTGENETELWYLKEREGERKNSVKNGYS